MIKQLAGLLLALTLLPATIVQSGQIGPKARPATAQTSVSRKEDSGRRLVLPRWWEKASAIVRVSLKQRGSRPAFPLDPVKASAQLDDLRARGISAIEIFAPAYGGSSYGGLDTKDRYRIDPAAGTMDDFRRLVRLVHSKGLAIITFDNLGYISVDSPEWLKACDDVRAGRDTREARWFLWSDRPDAPPPSGDSIFMIPREMRTALWRRGNGDLPIQPPDADRRRGGDYMRRADVGDWEFSKRAGKYYWSKWWGVDDAGNDVQLPHYNWANREWQEEAEKILRFWMDTGLDGLIMDAPRCYVNCGWEMNRRHITGVIASYRDVYMQPEGAALYFHDPSVWITEGGYNSMQDYALGDRWGIPGPLRRAMETGDPRPIEAALRDYRDRVVEAGGVLYFAWGERLPGMETQKQKLALTTAGLAGEMVQFSYAQALQIDANVQRLLSLKQAHPALQNLSARRQLPTSADDKHYAFLNTAADRSERILVVMNFQSTAQTVQVDLSGVATAGLIDLESRTESPRQWSFKVELPAYGYRLYQVKPAAASSGK